MDSWLRDGPRPPGRSAVTGLARLDGWPVAVLANDPYHYAGGWTAAAQKVTRFVDLADTFHLPVVHLVDQPGFVIGTEAEHAATIRHGARALAAIYQATVPWCSVILRKVYGVAGAAHQTVSLQRIDWPGRRATGAACPSKAASRPRTRPSSPCGRRSRGAAAEIEARLQRRPLAVPHRRGLPGRGDHRPARHPPAAVRVREPRRAAAAARQPADSVLGASVSDALGAYSPDGASSR